VSGTGKARFWTIWSLCLLLVIGLAAMAASSSGVRSLGEAVSSRPGEVPARVAQAVGSTLNYPGDALAGLVNELRRAAEGWADAAGDITGIFGGLKGMGEGLSGAFGGVGKSIGGIRLR